MIRCLTLTQPWASLVAHGVKSVETRSWYPGFRGPLAIHASKGFPTWAREFMYASAVKDMLAIRRISPEEINDARGKIIATCTLVKVLPTERVQGLSPGERYLGDYSRGRYAWFLEDVQRLTEPIPARGSLGLWEFDLEGAYAR